MVSLVILIIYILTYLKQRLKTFFYPSPSLSQNMYPLFKRKYGARSGQSGHDPTRKKHGHEKAQLVTITKPWDGDVTFFWKKNDNTRPDMIQHAKLGKIMLKHNGPARGHVSLGCAWTVFF